MSCVCPDPWLLQVNGVGGPVLGPGDDAKAFDSLHVGIGDILVRRLPLCCHMGSPQTCYYDFFFLNFLRQAARKLSLHVRCLWLVAWQWSGDRWTMYYFGGDGEYGPTPYGMVGL